MRRQALRDDSPLVRAAAVRTLDQTATPAQLLEDAAPLLRDPVRTVRIAAAARLVSAAPQLAASQFRPALDGAVAEFRAAQSLNLDRADAHMSLASLSEQFGDLREAIAAFRNAMRVEPYRAGPRRELARLLETVASDPAQAGLRDDARRHDR